MKKSNYRQVKDFPTYATFPPCSIASSLSRSSRKTSMSTFLYPDLKTDFAMALESHTTLTNQSAQTEGDTSTLCVLLPMQR
jgi:hypothetical protein